MNRHPKGEVQCHNTVLVTAQNSITRWKQELVGRASDLFGKGKKKEVNHDAEVADLHRLIGKLKVENDFLSNLPGLSSIGRRNSK